jgi:hypothetical protein
VSSLIHGFHVRELIVSSIFCASALGCGGQTRDVVCQGGTGSFESSFRTGVKVTVGAVRNHEFAARACEAKLAWGDQDLTVIPQAWQVDVDAMGVDLGLGALVVALQIKETDVDGFMRYEIYSLDKPPQRLRVITGGDWYSAADTDLDGRVEIWTDDAAAVNGFDDMPRNAFDFAPPVVLRFEQKKLIDASSEFQPAYDRRIAALRAQLSAQQLSDFKHSDGLLKTLYPPTPEEWASLRATKARVLEIAWCYLYSGRDQEAWNTLAEMWPPADVDRIRAAILSARAGGIRREVDGVSPGRSRFPIKKHALVYDRVSDSVPDSNPLAWAYAPGMSGPSKDDVRSFEADTFPIRILMNRPVPPADSTVSLRTEVPLDLIIDSAGKVRSAKLVGTHDTDLVEATAGWKFIPAFKLNKPVASRLRLGITPLQ